MKRVIPWFAVVLISSFTLCAYAQPVDMKALVTELRQGGYVIMFRHGATNLAAAGLVTLTAPARAPGVPSECRHR